MAGLSARLLVLTVLFVMLAEVMIYAPSAGRFRLIYLQDRLAAAHMATLALAASPLGKLDAELENSLLRHAGVESVIVRRGVDWTWMLAHQSAPAPDLTVDLRDHGFFRLIADAFLTLAHSHGRVLQVIGPSPMNADVTVEIIINEAPMRWALIDFSRRILQLSLIISAITATLLYLSLQLMIVRPLGQLTDSMLRFRERPEDETSDVAPSERRDEIGVAERVFGEMRAGLRRALNQRAHLAALGEAVVKINHDLRNILSSAQMISDRLAQSNDPRVRATAPSLLQAIDRAVGLCSQVVLFSQARRPSLRLAPEALYDLMEEVGDQALAVGETMEQEQAWRWVNEVDDDVQIRCDRQQMLRVFENIARNAYEAGATEVRVDAQRVRDNWLIGIADNGPGLPKQAKDNLFEPFRGSARSGGTGLGLAIARELTVAHGGRLFLERTGPAGTRFVVELPISKLDSENRRRVA